MNPSVTIHAMASGPTRRWIVLGLWISGALTLVGFLGDCFADSKRWLVFFDNLHWTTAYIAAVLMGWMGVRTATPECRAPRAWFTAGLAASALGQLISDIQIYTGTQRFPAPSDFFYLLLGVCSLAGLISTLRTSVPRSELKTFVLDAVSLAVVVLMLTLAFYLPRRGATPLFSFLVMIAYPAGILTPASVVIMMIPTLRLRANAGWIALLVSLLWSGALYIQWNVLALDAVLKDGSFYNACFSLTALLNGYGAMRWQATRSTNPQWDRRCEGILQLLPVVVVIITSVGLILALTIPGTVTAVKYVALTGSMIVAGTALARQSLLLQERDRLLFAERRARDHQLDYKALFESAHDAILVLRGSIVDDCNPSTLALLERSSRELIGHSLVEFSPSFQAGGTPSDEQLNRLLDNAVVGKSPCFEWTFLRPDGGWLHTEVRLSPLERSSGLMTHVVVRDITERKMAEEALQMLLEAETRMSKLAGNLPGIVFTLQLRPDGIFSLPYISPKADALIGMSRVALEADAGPILERIHPDDRSRVVESLRESAAMLKSWRLGFRASVVSGAESWMEGRAVVERDPEGGVLWHGILLDVSHQRIAELELERHRKELQLILDSVPALIFFKDRDHRLLRVNAEAVRVTGLPREQIEGFTDRELKREQADGYFRDEDEVMSTGIPKRGIVEELQTANGPRSMLTDKLPYRDENGKIVGIVGFSLDITERRRAEMEREKLESELRQSQKMEAIGQLAGGVAHDFNNILAIIHCAASLLSETTAEAETRNFARQIQDAVDRAAKMIRQLLLVGRRKAMEPVNLDVGEVSLAMTGLLQPLVGKQIPIDVQVEPNLPRARADASMIEQVLLNLTVNARDAMPSGGRLRIRVDSIEVSDEHAQVHPLARPGRFVRLSVTDQGGGISVEHLPRIFDPFFTTKEPGKGTGLGLATVYGIIRQHEGWIEVDSESGKGSEFRVYLPISDETDSPSGTASGPVRCLAGRGTILLVEDEPALRAMAQSILERGGYEVVPASNGPSALKLWADCQGKFDLLFTDLVMPEGLSGGDLAMHLRGERADLPVLFTSGYSSDLPTGAAGAFAGSEVEGFLTKPYNPEQLLKAVSECLDRARAKT